MAEPGGTVETVEEYPDGPPGRAMRWNDELKVATDDPAYKRWTKRAEAAIDRYRDERSAEVQSSTRALSDVRFNILWPNTETLRPSLFSNQPQPIVERRHKDADPIGRTSAEVLQRCLAFALDDHDFDDVAISAVEDYLLAGFGNARVVYEPTFGTDADGNEVKVYERCTCEYVFYEDFLWQPQRKWPHVQWVAYRSYPDREHLVRRFGADIGNKVSLDRSSNTTTRKEANRPPPALTQRAELWEIWHKPTRKVIWIAPSSLALGPLDEKDDPLGLDGFFPSPRPLLSFTTSRTLVPTPEYYLYQDQARELDILTQRIAILSAILRVVGIYDKSSPQIKQLLSNATENELIGVDNWLRLVEKGGIEGVIAWLPIEQIVGVLERLYVARAAVKQDIYELTGMSDIIRGASDPRETAAAQEMKGRYVNLRLSERQRKVARWVRDIFRIMAEIIAEHYEAATLAVVTGLQLPTDADLQAMAAQTGQPPPPNVPTWERVVATLRSERTRPYKIAVETDTTIQPDAEIEKRDRTEFVAAVGGFLKETLPLVQQLPEFLPMAAELLMFVARGFKAGRTLEGTFEETMRALQARQQQAQQGAAPDPKLIEVQAKIEALQAKTQAEIAATEAKTAADLQATISKAKGDEAKIMAAIQADRQKMQAELRLKMEQLRNEFALKVAEARMEQQVAAANAREPVTINVDRETAKIGEVVAANTEAIGALRTEMDGLMTLVAQAVEKLQPRNAVIEVAGRDKSGAATRYVVKRAA